MKLIRALVLSLVLVVPQALAIEAGKAAPPIMLRSLDNKVVRLSDFADKVVFVDFWASWCGPCKQSLPWLQQMQEKYGANGLQILAVNVDTDPGLARDMLSQLKVNLLTLSDPDGKTPESYEVESMPSSFLIGRNGHVAVKHCGFSSSDREALEHAIQAML